MAASLDIRVVGLPEILDLNEAGPLATRLRNFRGRAVHLDASRVERLGGLCLQVLLSARDSWASDNFPITVINPSAAFADAITRFGASNLIT